MVPPALAARAPEGAGRAQPFACGAAPSGL